MAELTVTNDVKAAAAPKEKNWRIGVGSRFLFPKSSTRGTQLTLCKLGKETRRKEAKR